AVRRQEQVINESVMREERGRGLTAEAAASHDGAQPTQGMSYSNCNRGPSPMPSWISNPWAKAGVTALSGLLAVALVFVVPGVGRRWMLLYYFVPVGVAFVAFALDRFAAWGEHSVPRLVLDLVVVGWSSTRAVYELPLASGHALFLT